MSICIRFRLSRNTRRVACTTVALAALSVLAIASGGCVYRMAVQQGNFLDPAQVQQLQTGMTRAQVRFLLGTPMLPDMFQHDRWDYIYYLKTGRIKKPQESRLTVWFDKDKVARFEALGIVAPPQSPEIEAPKPDSPAAQPGPAEPSAPSTQPGQAASNQAAP